jgi:hypothetical protein
LPQDQQDIEAGRAVLASIFESGEPAWGCLDCKPSWTEVNRLALQDYAWHLAKEKAVALAEFDRARELRDAQRELRPKLDALLKELSGG